MEKRARLLAKQGNVFWKVEPKVGLTEVSGLSTILSGVYIGVMTDKRERNELLGAVDQFHFEAAMSAPIDVFDPGRRFLIKSTKSDVKAGAPITYRSVVVGDVEEVRLTKDGVEYAVHIEENYSDLVKKDSKFWKVSGLDIKASLSGIKFNVDSLASVIAGGISFSSPEDSQILNEDGAVFELYSSETETFLSENLIRLNSNNGHKIEAEDSYVYYKGIEAGRVEEVDYNPDRHDTTFKISLYDNFRSLANAGAHFWIVEPKLGLYGVNGLDAIAKGPYITFVTTDKSAVPQNEFVLNSEAPIKDGLHVRLKAPKSYGLKEGVNVSYNNLVIGTLHKTKISKKGDVNFELIINNDYKHLINETSSFYVKSAIQADVTLKGLRLDIGSVDSILHSGIELVTQDLNNAKPQGQFDLLENLQAYKDLVYTKDGGEFVTIITDELGSLSVDAPLIYKGFSVGKIMSINLDSKSEKVIVKAYLEGEFTNILNASSRFYNLSGVEVKLDMNGVKLRTGSLESIIAGGIGISDLIENKDDKLPESFKLFADKDAAESSFIQVGFSTGIETDLKKGSKIIYKSLVIGQIQEVSLVKDQLYYEALIDEMYSEVLADDSKFWVESFEFNIDQIKNPSALISGAFIKVDKGRSEMMIQNFELLNNPPPKTINKEGLRVLLKAERKGSLSIDSPVFYRQIKIGSVEAFKLSADSTKVEMRVFIYPEFSYLVRKNSLFYIASVVGVDVSLFGAKLSTETLSTMIHGGITMVVPNQPNSLAEQMQIFTLHNEPDDDWLEFNPVIIKENNMKR